ncbi:MAG: hypothetical protein K1X79_09305 [Oligoflexia bacterium]|nr:hypothetical protein [Oligoflexia bacterium]
MDPLLVPSQSVEASQPNSPESTQQWDQSLRAPASPTRLFHLAPQLLAMACAAALPERAEAQQNLFNMPSGIITAPGTLFFQEQMNLFRRAGNSGTTFDIGLGKGWEAGINLLDVSLYDRLDRDNEPAQIGETHSPGSPDLMLNVQKGFEVTRWWRSSIGTQVGSNIDFGHEPARFLNFSWTSNAFSVPSHPEYGTWYVGGYYANPDFAGGGTNHDLLLGCEIPVVGHHLAFQADAVLGRNDLSVIVIGGVYSFENRWQISLGAQIPTENSGNPFGVVVEFTYPGPIL